MEDRIEQLWDELYADCMARGEVWEEYAAGLTGEEVRRMALMDLKSE